MMARRVATMLALLFALAGTTFAFAAPASAHPLGNATVNSADRLVVTPDALQVTHVLDLAEIPTLQVVAEMEQREQDLATFARERCAADAQDAVVRINGARTALTSTTATGVFAAGQAELQTLRVECQWEAQWPTSINASEATVTFAATPIDVAGWREISAAGDSTTLTGSTVPDTSPTNLLQSYPQVAATEIPRTSTASFDFAVGGRPLSSNAVAASASDTSPLPTDVTTRWLGGLVDGATSPLGAVLTLLLAGIVGAFHALTPGHGKTAVAFALAGQERSTRAAITVGVTVTTTHTVSVLILGTLVASTTALAPAAWIPILSVASGLLVLGVGGLLFRRARQGQHGHIHRGGANHSHSHPDDQSHPHDHEHGRPRGHGHAATAVITKPAISAAPSSHSPRMGTARATLIALGVAGGVVPSPSALLVLLGAAAIGRPWWGVLLVIAFGIGMALTLAVAGLLAWQVGERVSTWATQRQNRSVTRLVRVFPQLAALGVCGAGVVVIARGLGIL